MPVERYAQFYTLLYDNTTRTRAFRLSSVLAKQKRKINKPKVSGGIFVRVHIFIYYCLTQR